MVDESRQRVRDGMEQRREELGLSQEALASAAGTSLSTVGRLERGNYVSPRMVARVERALGWRKGSIAAIREGRQPGLLDDASPEPSGPDPLLAEIQYFRRLLGKDDFDRMFALFEALNESNRRFDEEQGQPSATESDPLKDAG